MSGGIARAVKNPDKLQRTSEVLGLVGLYPCDRTLPGRVFQADNFEDKRGLFFTHKTAALLPIVGATF